MYNINYLNQQTIFISLKLRKRKIIAMEKNFINSDSESIDDSLMISALTSFGMSFIFIINYILKIR